MFIKRDIFKAISFRNPVKLPLSYWLLVVTRFVLTTLPQLGYIHPDEFFQNVEVVAGDIFPIDVARTWEFNPKFPIRNMFIPKVVLGTPLYLIYIFNPYTKTYLSIDLQTPYYLSFSNTFEMIFFSLLLLVVAECMFKSDKVIYHDEFLTEKYNQAQTPVEKVKIFKLKTHLPEHSLNSVFILATLVVIGIFNRPTFVGFAFVPIFFWFQRGLGSRVVSFKDFNCRIFSFMLCGVPISFLLVMVDSCYYGYLTSADVESFALSWDNWVVTPLNFIRYNLDTRNLKEHGIHPRWLHLIVNMPLLFNVLGIIALIILSSNTYRFIRGQYSKLPRIQSITGLMLFSLVTPVAVLSFFPHQEARFIIPVLIPLVYLYGNHLHPNEADTPTFQRAKNTLRYTWYILNILLTVFFGFIHQGGIIPFTNTLHQEIRSNYGVHTHVITTHSYSIPSYLLQLESTTKLWKDQKSGRKYRLAPTTFLHKYGSLPMDALFGKVDEVLTNAEMLLHKYKRQYRFYIASPCSLEREILAASSVYHYIDFEHEFSYYPHFCTEAFPKFPSKRDQFCFESDYKRTNVSQAVDLSIYQRISCFVKKFCLSIYRVRALS